MKLLTRHEEHVLLTILNLKDNAYLVTIRDYLITHSGQKLSFGTLYVSLNRLEKAGYINHRIGEATSKRGGKAIKYFSITRLGLVILSQVRKVQDTMWANFTELSYTTRESNE